MADQRSEIAIVGGGLAGGLIALAITRARPDMQVTLLEAGESLGGHHRWSWFDTDLDREGAALLASCRKTEWQGYDVRFPAHRRTLRTGYNSMASTDFDACLKRELPPETIRLRRPVAALDGDGVTLENGERISARAVIDCRAMELNQHLTGGWQVFMGRHIRTKKPHGIKRPVIMDADVEQHGAYRFIYVLPLGLDEIFVEDTYYADSPVLDRSALSSRIDQHCNRFGLDGQILGGETGVLPVITGGDFAAWQDGQRITNVGRAGARGGFVHPLTSYTLPFAVETALAIAREADLPGEQLAALLEDRAQRHWAQTKFYRRLGRMLFGAGKPDERYRIFERFYRLDEALIERFYAGRSRFGDRMRILAGKPPVPLGGAFSALSSKGRPLVPAAGTRA